MGVWNFVFFLRFTSRAYNLMKVWDAASYGFVPAVETGWSDTRACVRYYEHLPLRWCHPTCISFISVTRNKFLMLQWCGSVIKRTERRSEIRIMLKNYRGVRWDRIGNDSWRKLQTEDSFMENIECVNLNVYYSSCGNRWFL